MLSSLKTIHKKFHQFKVKNRSNDGEGFLKFSIVDIGFVLGRLNYLKEHSSRMNHKYNNVKLLQWWKGKYHTWLS